MGAFASRQARGTIKNGGQLSREALINQKLPISKPISASSSDVISSFNGQSITSEAPEYSQERQDDEIVRSNLSNLNFDTHVAAPKVLQFCVKFVSELFNFYLAYISILSGTIIV